MRITTTYITLFATAVAVNATNTTWSWCQYPKAQGQQLTGCPSGTVYVSQTDPQAGFGTIQDAIESL
jgi:hypothetical protein